MPKQKSILKVIIEILSIIFAACTLLFVLQLRPMNASNPNGSSNSYPPPKGFEEPTITPTLQEGFIAYPAPSQEPTESKVPNKPPACDFSNNGIFPKQNVENIGNYQFSNPRIIFTSKNSIGIANWLPDSERLLIEESIKNGRYSIETFNFQTGELTSYAERYGAGGKPVWINDLDAIAFATVVNNHEELWISNKNSTNTNVITPDVFGLSVASYRNQLAYFSPTLGDIPQTWNAASKAITSEKVNLLDDEYQRYPNIKVPIIPGKTFVIAPQPTGNRMALFGRAWFFIYDELIGNVCDIDLGINGGWPISVLQAEWSPDGHYIALITSAYSPSQQIPYSNAMIIDFETGKQTTIQLDVPFVYDISWSSNNQFLALLGADQNEHEKGLPGSRIFVANILENNKPVMISDQLFGGGTTDGWELSWSPNGNEIAVKCPTWSQTEPIIIHDNICVIDVTKKP